jgi:hypothetical protein
MYRAYYDGDAFLVRVMHTGIAADMLNCQCVKSREAFYLLQHGHAVHFEHEEHQHEEGGHK